jgi:uncharacterized protein
MRARVLHQRLGKIQGRRLVIITGARQTGKTTLARRCYPDLRYVNLDAIEYRDMVREVSSFHWARDVGVAVLDEAQKEPSVFDKVKFAYDEGQLDFTVLLGSSQILLLKKVRESLAGRAFVLELWPLMLSELCSDATAAVAPPLLSPILNDGPADTLSGVRAVMAGPAAEAAQEAEAHLLRWGGMPELLRLAPDQRREWLRSYETTYLERDLTDLARLDDLQPFRKFQRLAALRAAGLLNYSELARDAGVSVDTSRRYLEYLRLSYQTLLLQPWQTNLTSAVVKSPKLYWVDVGLLRGIGGLGEAVTGELFENYVVSEIWKWCKTRAEPTELYFYRTRSGMEVDALLDTPAGLLGIEIKRREIVTPSDAGALRRLAASCPDRWAGGLLVYRGNRIEQLAPDVWAVPSWRLLANLP